MNVAPALSRLSLRVTQTVILTGILVLAGCTAGPKFKQPAPPTASGYLSHPVTPTVATSKTHAGASQQFSNGAEIPGDWWRLFHSQALDTMVSQALTKNPSLKATQAALQAAHEDVLTQHGVFLPAVSAGFSGSRQRQPSTLAPVPNFPTVPQEYLYSLFTPQLNISYAPDVFGLHRRTRESLRAQEQAVRFQMIAAWTTLTTNVVATAVQEASLREQMTATRKLIQLEKHSLSILQLRLKKGDTSELDVSAQQAQVAQSEAGLTVLAKQLAVTQHALAALIGDFPDQLPEATFTLSDLTLPAGLPLSLPSQLVAQRPDVRMARADLHAASAAVGIAAAERLPQIELTADAGSTALAISKIFTSGGFWGVAGSLVTPVFDGGQLKHQELAAKATYTEAAQLYRGTVLQAFENVADTLVALNQDAQALQASATAERAARTTLDLSQLRLQHGVIGAFELLAAEQSYQQAKIGLLQAETNRFVDTAALYQALGGGWWHHANLAKD